MKDEFNKILSLIKDNKLLEAKDACLNILKTSKDNEEIYNIYGIILIQLDETEEAILNWQKAIEIKPDYSHAYNNLGKGYLKLNKYNEALVIFEKVIKINPKYFEAHYYKALLLNELQRYDEAIDSWSFVIGLKPDFVKAYINRGNIFCYLKKFDRAINNYTSAYLIEPNSPFLLGSLVHTKSVICDWEDQDKYIEELKKNLINHKKTIDPFSSLVLLESPSMQKMAAEIWTNESNLKIKKIENISKKKKITIGYYSGDFNNHAVGHLISNMLELHDKNNFEIFGFYFGKKILGKDKVQERIVSSFDKFVDISLMSTSEIIKLSRNLKIDIAIDLTGHTGSNNRFDIFTNRCAPIQVNFLGYPGTTGSKSIEYIIADEVLIPLENQQNYSEKIVYLPNTYQPNEPTKKISKKIFQKEEFNLPEKSFVYCCFNSHQKITPAVFKIWMSILKKSDGSVLWLLDDNEMSLKNLRLEASSHKVNPNRLIFAGRAPLEEHLARLKFADLFLDTFPYTAHTTASDSLRMGVPVLTCVGQTFASRVAASLLKAIGLPELITLYHKDYEDMAIKIFNNSIYLQEIKLKLKKNKLDKPLFDSKLFTKNLEKAYSRIYEKFINNEKIDHVNIKS